MIVGAMRRGAEARLAASFNVPTARLTQAWDHLQPAGRAHYQAAATQHGPFDKAANQIAHDFEAAVAGPNADAQNIADDWLLAQAILAYVRALPDGDWDAKG